MKQLLAEKKPHCENDSEQARLNALLNYGILDTPQEAAFDAITELAALTCGTPIALISLVDDSRQWFKANYGLAGTCSTSRDVAFCHHAIAQQELFEISDATQDDRFSNNPLVQEDPTIRFYAGQPLVTSDGHALGTLCVIGQEPKTLSASQRTQLKKFAALVMVLLEGHKKRLHEQVAAFIEPSIEAIYLLDASNLHILYHYASPSNQLTTKPTSHFLELWQTEKSLIAGAVGSVQTTGKVFTATLTDTQGRCFDTTFKRLQAYHEHSPIMVLCRPADSSQNQAALTRLQNEFQLLAEASPAIVFKTDENGQNTYVNQRWLDITGLSFDQCRGDGWATAVFEDDQQFAFATWQNAVSNQAKWMHEFRFIHANGNITWMLGQAHPIFDGSGHFAGHIGVCTDISRGVHEQKDMLAQQARLSQTMRINYFGEMATTIAHQLNQPLTAITNYAEVVSDLLKGNTSISEDAVSSVERIIAQARYAGDIIQHIRRMIKRETTSGVVQIDLMVTRLLKLLAREIKERHVEVEINSEKSLPTICADQVQIEHVVINLLKNALESFDNQVKPEAKRLIIIEVEATSEKMIEISVKDNGVGISDEDQSKIFTPFFSNKSSGLGLGLSMSQTIVESHGGRMWLATDNSGFTQFSLALPITQQVNGG